VDQNALPRDPNNMKEDERIAEMGKPRLGDHDKIRINIKESAEFKVIFYFLFLPHFIMMSYPVLTHILG